MSKRFDRITFALTVTLAALASACSSDPDAPLVQEPASDPGKNLMAQPAPAPTPAPTTTAPPPVSDFDAAAPPIAVADAGVTPTPVTPGPPVACPPGGEVEVEPNDGASPNPLNGVRCGVLTPGDTDVLIVSLTAFNISWTGAVNIVPSQPTAGGPYHLTITSQTPSVNTAWQVTLK